MKLGKNGHDLSEDAKFAHCIEILHSKTLCIEQEFTFLNLLDFFGYFNGIFVVIFFC